MTSTLKPTSEYVKVLSHDTKYGLFKHHEDALWKNADNPSATLYSILGQLEQYRNYMGNFQFKLCYPELNGRDPITPTINSRYPSSKQPHLFSTFKHQTTKLQQLYSSVRYPTTLRPPLFSLSIHLTTRTPAIFSSVKIPTTVTFQMSSSFKYPTTFRQSLYSSLKTPTTSRSGFYSSSTFSKVTRITTPLSFSHSTLNPISSHGKCNVWSQSSNPATETTITGFEAISLAFTKNSYNHSWTGLGRNTNPNADAVIDDAPGADVSFRWSALGAISFFGGDHTIPGPIGHLVTKVEFYVVKPPPQYVKVFSHHTADGLFSSHEDALSRNADNPFASLYSILGQLDSYRNYLGYFQFRLCYPELIGVGGSHCNVWIQSSNPATETTITGFEAISLAFTKNSYNHSWVGLGRNPNPNADAVIDDAPSTDVFYRWSAVGAIRFYEGNHTRFLQSNNTIPGPVGHLVTKVDFFVKTGASKFLYL